jgi:hypothetical protein
MNDYKIRKCKNCGVKLDKIVYSDTLSEEWQWNGTTWECLGYTSLIHNPEKSVVCPECGVIVGTGIDFGFGKPQTRITTL